MVDDLHNALECHFIQTETDSVVYYQDLDELDHALVDYVNSLVGRVGTLPDEIGTIQTVLQGSACIFLVLLPPIPNLCSKITGG